MGSNKIFAEKTWKQNMRNFDFKKAYFYNSFEEIEKLEMPLFETTAFLTEDVSGYLKKTGLTKEKYWIVMWRKVYLFSDDKLFTLVKNEPEFLFYHNIASFQQNNIYTDYSMVGFDQFVYNSNMDDNQLIEKHLNLYFAADSESELNRLNKKSIKDLLANDRDLKKKYRKPKNYITNKKNEIKEELLEKAFYDLIGFCFKTDTCSVEELKKPAYYPDEIYSNKICFDAENTKKIIDYYGWSPEGCLYYNKIGAVYFEDFILTYNKRQAVAKIKVNDDLLIYISNPDIFAKYGFDHKKYNFWFSYKGENLIEDLTYHNLIKIIGIDKEKLKNELEEKSNGYTLTSFLIKNYKY